MTHIMENIIFNELQIRECSVDIGIVYGNEKNAKGKITPVAREIDFIAASGGKKTYIQSAYALGTEEKAITENKPFALTGDSFPKIIVRMTFASVGMTTMEFSISASSTFCWMTRLSKANGRLFGASRLLYAFEQWCGGLKNLFAATVMQT